MVESEYSAEREALLEQLEEGAILKGVVKNLTDYGAFLDLGGIDGLLHITDMAWKRVRHPSEVVNVGDELEVRVLRFDRERNRVSLGLKQIQPEYDFIILDCPPSLGLLTVNAITASDFFMVTVSPEYLGFEGLLSLMDAVALIKEGIGKAGSFLGIVLTMADYRQKVTKDIGEKIRDKFGDLVFKTEIRVNVRLKEAPSLGKSINEYDRKCAGAKAYRNLSREVVKRIRQTNV